VIDGATGNLERGGGVDALRASLRRRARRERARHGAGLARLRPRGARSNRGLVAAFLAIALSDLAARVLGRESSGPSKTSVPSVAAFVTTYRDPQFVAGLAETPVPSPR